jgi:prolyl oligopeptidase
MRFPRPTLLFAMTVFCACATPQQESRSPIPAPAPPEASSAALPTPPPAPSLPPPPPTERRATVAEYHGVKITDDYAWLERAGDSDVAAWSRAQNAYTRSILDAYPDRAPIRARVRELLVSQSSSYTDVRARGKVLFALKDQPPKQQPFLVVLASADDTATERIIVDPNELDPSGKTTIDMYAPTRDGKLVAVSLSQGGSESGDLHVYDVATGKARPDVVPRAHGGTAGGSVAWNAYGNGFFYTRYPRKGERPPLDMDFYQQVYFHWLGRPSSEDDYAVGRDFPRIAEIELEASDDGRFTLAKVANGDGGDFSFHVRGAKGAWTEIAPFGSKVIGAQFGRDNRLYLLSRAAPRGQVLRLSSPAVPLGKAEVVVPEGDAVIQRMAVTGTRLFLVDLVGGPSQIRAIPIGSAKGDPALVPILPVSNVDQIERLPGDEVLFRNQSYVEPAAWYRYDPKSATTTKTALVETTIADMSEAEVAREECTSKDGTKVPLNVIRRKGARYDGSNIALLGGYGGYGISRSPRFSPRNRLWLDQGGIYADANLRGGGEFGEDWHYGGNLLNKQNVFDDFFACAKHLVDEAATAPERLAILGGSNGGLLMGAELVQHPEMYRAVVSLVGIYDMLKVEDTPNGAFNVTEFGTVKNPDQFRALYAYSPYHNVKDGTSYPAVLFMTGANDPRVDPYNSRKMTARLQAATSGKNPVLLRASADTGHGIGTPLDAEIDELTDGFAFILHELGVSFRADPAAPVR